MTFPRAPSCQIAQLEFNTRLVAFILGKESRVLRPDYIYCLLPPVLGSSLLLKAIHSSLRCPETLLQRPYLRVLGMQMVSPLKAQSPSVP